MRTLVAAAEPEPQPRISFTSTTGTATSTAIVWWQVPTQTVPREPYRTTAYVGEPVKEIEEGD